MVALNAKTEEDDYERCNREAMMALNVELQGDDGS